MSKSTQVNPWFMKMVEEVMVSFSTPHAYMIADLQAFKNHCCSQDQHRLLLPTTPSGQYGTSFPIGKPKLHKDHA